MAPVSLEHHDHENGSRFGKPLHNYTHCVSQDCIAR